MKIFLFLFPILAISYSISAQERLYYQDSLTVNIDYLDGRLPPVLGVHNIQVMRANRTHPQQADNLGHTYNHAPMLCYDAGRFYLEYLSNPIGEHMMPGVTLLTSSTDGYNWDTPKIIFPEYPLPEGISKPGKKDITQKGMTAVMHQRMGFYKASNGRLLCLGYYGISLNPKDAPNKGDGIGRVVRELKADGTIGPIYFIRYNKQFGEHNTLYPLYTHSEDKAFVQACNELLANRLYTQQWAEEQNPDDPIISLKQRNNKAFCFYHLDDGRVVGLWKQARTAISHDEGATWTKVSPADGIINGNGKIWGQKTSDGKFALIYNPSLFRWPLALSLSDDGLCYRHLFAIHGDGGPMRYAGHYKNYGPQYVRGITEGNGVPPDGNLWITYSFSKEDIWISRIPIPVEEAEVNNVNDDFNQMVEGKELDRWNIYSPVWAHTGIEKAYGKRMLVLRDKDPYDYAKAERIFPETTWADIKFTFIPGSMHEGQLTIELQNATGTSTLRLIADAQKGTLATQEGSKLKSLIKIIPEKTYSVEISLNCRTMTYALRINDTEYGKLRCFAPIQKTCRLVFKTGQPYSTREFYDPEPDFPDLPGAGDSLTESFWYITQVSASPIK